MQSSNVKSKKSSFAYRFSRNKVALAAFFVFAIIALISLTCGLWLDYDIDVIGQDVANRLQPPSSEHLLGTDEYGRDVFARIVYGARYSLIIGFSTVLMAATGGLIIGSISGYCGKTVDNILMRAMDVLLAIPLILLAVVIVSVLGTGLQNVILALALAYLPDFARQTRVAMLSIKDREFVESARAVGTPHMRIIAEHLIPNMIGPIIVKSTLAIGGAMCIAASISYLGLGVQTPLPEWGNMLSEGKKFLRTNPTLVIFPCAAIVTTVLMVNLIGDGVRDAIDPRLRD